MSMVIPDMYVIIAEKGRLKNIDQKFLSKSNLVIYVFITKQLWITHTQV